MRCSTGRQAGGEARRTCWRNCGSGGARGRRRQRRTSDADGRRRPLLDALGYDPVGLDALVARTGIPRATLQAQLLELELAGDVARLPGGLFQRTAAA